MAASDPLRRLGTRVNLVTWLVDDVKLGANWHKYVATTRWNKPNERVARRLREQFSSVNSLAGGATNGWRSSG